MPYITDTDFEQAFGADELADLTGDGAEFAMVEANVTGLINGYIASRYALPLAAVPDMLKAWALDIVRFRLWDEQAPEEVRRRYDDAIAQLRDLARGLISLPPDASGVSPAAPLEFEGYGNERVFTADTLKGF